MANCELKVLGNPIPLAKIKLDDERGYTRWVYIPIAADGGAQNGKVKVEGKNSKLLYDSGKHVGKSFGTLINFTLQHYNKAIIYTFAMGNKNLRCKCEDDDFEINTDF